MYQDHFGMRNMPFGNTQDTNLFFAGGHRNIILDALVYAITTGDGLIKLVGETGSGKTMLCRMAACTLPASYDVIFLLAPSLAGTTLFRLIATQVGVTLDRSCDSGECFHLLGNHLREKYAAGRHVVVFVEEGQNLSLAALEEIRLLGNLETPAGKLLQIVLIGQPPLNTLLATGTGSNLVDRIDRSLSLPLLQGEDVKDYLRHGLERAGLTGDFPFSPDAVKSITRLSGGKIRQINKIAHYALLAAFARNKATVGSKEVYQAAQQCHFLPARRGSFCNRSCFLGGILLLVAGSGWFFSQPIHQIANSSIHIQTPPPPVPPTKVEKPVVQNSSTHAETPPPPPIPPARVEKPVIQDTPPQETMVPPAAKVREEVHPQAASVDPPPVEETTVVAVPPPPPVERATAEAVVLTSHPAVDNVVLGGVSLPERVRQSEEWLAATPGERVSIQLLLIAPGGPDPVRSLIKLFQDTENSLNQKLLHVFPLKNGGFLVYYGEYSTPGEARRTISRLPHYLKRTKPYGQSLSLMRRELERIALTKK